MIDIGLSKIALIGVIALLVVGPERLPRVARLAGTLLGRAQRYIRDVKSEVNRTIELDELRSAQNDLRDAAGDIERTLRDAEAYANGPAADGANGLASVSQQSMTEREYPSPGWLGAMQDQNTVKAKMFRKSRALHTSAVPSWYKRQGKHRTSVVSCAARRAAHRAHKNSAYSHL